MIVAAYDPLDSLVESRAGSKNKQDFWNVFERIRDHKKTLERHDDRQLWRFNYVVQDLHIVDS